MINMILQIMIKVEITEKWFRQAYPIEYNPFTLIHNILGFLKEILTWFIISWNAEEKKEASKPEHTIQKDRITTITRWGYIQTFSIIEFTIKLIIKKEKYPSFEECIDKWGRGEVVSFYNIIKIFYETEKISDAEYTKWNILREIRNCLVHNNAYSDKEISYELNGQKIVRTENYMLLGDLDGLIFLIDQITKLYSILLWNISNSEKIYFTSE